MLNSIDHINIVVSKLEETLEFFKLLGFEVEDRSSLKGDWISEIVGLENVKAEYIKLKLNEDNVRLELIKYHSPESDSEGLNQANTIGIRHIAFSVNNIEKTVQKLSDMNVNFMGKINTYERTGKKLIYFYGPDNILLELAEYPKD